MTMFATVLHPEGIVCPLVLAFIMGLTVGLERSVRGRAAGLRTYLLVCVSFTGIALLSKMYGLTSAAGFSLDPARLAAGGLTGIGFLGAGVILHSKNTVFGLTTAAGIWTMAVIGLALGGHHYPLAIALYLIVLSSLWLLRYVESLLPRETFREIVLQVIPPGLTIGEASQCFHQYRLTVQNVDIEQNKQDNTLHYTFLVHGKRPGAFVEAFRTLLQRDDVVLGKLESQGREEWMNEDSGHAH